MNLSDHLETQNSINNKAKELVSKMTLEEKASLCSGKNYWKLKSITRLGLDTITMTDGPNGLRKQITGGDNLGIGESVPAVCFPTASAAACSFDRDLVEKIGAALGEECRSEDVAVIFGPAANQKRSPLCGRNFEYYSEDPLLTGELAASLIKGIESTGTGTSLKHFAVNNQEKRRMTINAVVDERTLYDTYLRGFEIAVKKGRPAAVMCAYNKLNGTYCSENKYLLTDILRNKWGYKGAVISDWGAVHIRTLGIKAGLDLEMPGNGGVNDRKITEAVKNGTLLEKDLDKAAVNVTALILKGLFQRKNTKRYDAEKHHALAVSAAEQSAVLLKNEENFLPAKKNLKIAVIGAFAEKPRYQGAGSSKLHPFKVETPLESLKEQGIKFSYAKGYSLKGEKDNGQLLKEALKTAKGKDVVLIFAGLTEGYESEGFDRKSLELPKEHNTLIEEICKVNKNTAVILMGGSPCELPWIDKVKALLLTYLGGEGVGKAAVDLIFGKAVPCGKLAETWPLKLKDTPSYNYFPGGRTNCEYRESIYVGYRYYDKAGKEVLFPFGFGLSYTNFFYSNLTISQNKAKFGDELSCEFDITNTGKVKARETALIFVSHDNKKVFMPKKELWGFLKTELNAGETKRITAVLETESLGYYNTKILKRYAENGSYKVLVGPSLNELPLKAEFELINKEEPQPDYRKIAPSYFSLPKGEFKIGRSEFEALYGKKLPEEIKAERPFTFENTFEDIKGTFIGRILVSYVKKLTKKAAAEEEGQEGMLISSVMETPFFSMVTQGSNLVSERRAEGILDIINGKILRGILKIVKS